MSEYTRYAVYYAPEPGTFADFTAAWLGWDPVTGTERAHPDLGPDIEPITRTPRKYGFHGTLKPPMRLQGTPEEFIDDLEKLAGRLNPISFDRLELKHMGGFLALRPEGRQSDLTALAAEVVRALDNHRAPLTAAELKGRRKANLSRAQECNLAQWGYPYVMDEFRFHLTLSGRLNRTQAEKASALLQTHLLPLLPRPFVISDLCLFGEGKDGRFRLLRRMALGISESPLDVGTL